MSVPILRINLWKKKASTQEGTDIILDVDNNYQRHKQNTTKTVNILAKLGLQANNINFPKT